jgi:malonyl-CoA O-methyltransferase
MSNILARFDKRAVSYDAVAHVQKASAGHLAGLIPDDVLQKARTILDVGAGTGFVTQALYPRSPQAHFTLNDIAPQMLAVAKEKLHYLPHISLYKGDAETAQFPESPYDLIASNLTVQWFHDWQQGLQNLGAQTHAFAFATLMEGTFREWQALHDARGLASGLHHYPSFETLQDYVQSLSSNTVIVDRKTHTVPFKSPRDFVRYLKTLGANTPYHKYQSSTLRHVISLPNPLQVSYEVFYGVICKRPGQLFMETR